MTGVNEMDLKCVRGREFVFTVSGTKNGSAVTWNTGGYVLRFIAKWDWSDADASAVINLTNGSGITSAAGSFTVTIPASAWSTFPYNEAILRYELSLYDGSKSYTLMRGNLKVLPNVVRTAN